MDPRQEYRDIDKDTPPQIARRDAAFNGRLAEDKADFESRQWVRQRRREGFYPRAQTSNHRLWP